MTFLKTKSHRLDFLTRVCSLKLRKFTAKFGLDPQKADNTFKSRKRSRVEHVFGSIKSMLRGSKLRSIGLVRAKFNIGLMNLTYNLKRVEALIRLRLFEFDRVSPPVGR